MRLPESLISTCSSDGVAPFVQAYPCTSPTGRGRNRERYRAEEQSRTSETTVELIVDLTNGGQGGLPLL